MKLSLIRSVQSCSHFFFLENLVEFGFQGHGELSEQESLCTVINSLKKTKYLKFFVTFCHYDVKEICRYARSALMYSSVHASPGVNCSELSVWPSNQTHMA